jgi:cation transport ATPase
MKELIVVLRARVEMVLLVVALVLLAAGGVLYLADAHDTANVLWAVDTVVGIVPACWWVIDAARHRRLGVDALAVLALVGTLVIGEYLAGAVITVMLASGRTLEARAAGRARRELRALLARAPRIVHRYDAGELTAPSIDEVRRGDLLLVQPGEVVPVDGLVESEAAVLDESALTGEPLPVTRATGDVVRSGVVNAGSPFDLRATTSAAESTYAGIVRLVSEAEASSAPFVRLAERYAGVLLAVALAIAAVAWAVSGDLERAVAVLVVATPCPLILAAPVAIVSGLSRAARRGVVVKGGAPLEQLAAGEILLFDKTGTITTGHPRVADILTASDMAADDVLRYAASLDQVSPHVLAAAVVRAARARPGSRARAALRCRAHRLAARPGAHPRRRRPPRRHATRSVDRSRARGAPVPRRGARPARAGRRP